MSRRHHGGRPHRSSGAGRLPAGPTTAAQNDAAKPRFEPPTASGPPDRPVTPSAEATPPPSPEMAVPGPSASPPPSQSNDGEPRPGNGQFAVPPGCTAPQLRRFIKSRPYVPMHELRRRFGINGAEDDVTGIDLADGRVYVGLPAREGSLIGELLRGGEIGYELSLDPRSPVVVGLYPMRPVPRA
jgi:hypothetical protein